MKTIRQHGKRLLLEGLGWILVVVGIAALVLPGPGLLAIFAGMALLATQYEWANAGLIRYGVPPSKQPLTASKPGRVLSYRHVSLLAS